MRTAPPPSTPRHTVRLVLLVAALVGAGLVSLSRVQDAEAAVGDPVIVAAGDIACPNNIAAYNGGNGTATQCRQKYTSDMILDADHVLVLGDAQYSTGSLSQYRAVYDPTWGRKKSVTHPTPGDHDYASGSPTGYFSYWGVPEYYSFDIGSWHWVSLNSELDHTATSAQVQWLQQDLATTTAPCVGAFWGAPAFSSGKGNDPSFRPFWDALYARHADLVLAGDSHQYERFGKMAADGTAAADGIREFVVGTGGRNLTSFTTIQPNSEARAKVFGVLQMTLGSSGYTWQFRTESGGTFSDSGSSACNAGTGTTTPTDTTTPTSPTETTTPPTTPTTTPSPSPTTSAPLCYGVAATIVGTSAADTLTGTAGADVIVGQGGNDTINGGDGNDLICGVGGADRIDGGNGNDRINAGAGADVITDRSGADIIDGSTGNDSISVNDTLSGDTANGGGDTDTCVTDVGDKKSNCEQ
jgi:hypothetical protein